MARSSTQTITHLDLPPFFPKIGQQTCQELVDLDPRSFINDRLNTLAFAGSSRGAGKWKQETISDYGYRKHSDFTPRPGLLSIQEHRDTRLAIDSSRRRVIDGSTIEAQSDNGIFLDNGRGFISAHSRSQAMGSSDYGVPRRSNPSKEFRLAPSKYGKRRRMSRMVVDGPAEMQSPEVERARIDGARAIRFTPFQLPKLAIPDNSQLAGNQRSVESESNVPRSRAVSSNVPNHQQRIEARAFLGDSLGSLSPPATLSPSTVEPETSSRPLHGLSRFNLDHFDLLESILGLISSPKSTGNNSTLFKSSYSHAPGLSPILATPVEDQTVTESPQQTLEQTCGICGNESTALSIQPAPTRNCEHDTTTCQDCLQAWIKSQLNSEGCESIRCPDCPQMLSHAEVQSSADPEDFERYDTMKTRALLSTDPNFRWCIRPGCSSGQIHHLANTDEVSLRTHGAMMHCHACRFVQCVVHSCAWHHNETCDDYDDRTDPEGSKKAKEKKSQALIERMTKQCPNEKCGWRIEKNQGCNHMTCLKCRHEFCWECLVSFRSIRKFGNTAHAVSCQHYNINNPVPGA